MGRDGLSSEDLSIVFDDLSFLDFANSIARITDEIIWTTSRFTVICHGIRSTSFENGGGSELTTNSGVRIAGCSLGTIYAFAALHTRILEAPTDTIIPITLISSRTLDIGASAVRRSWISENDASSSVGITLSSRRTGNSITQTDCRLSSWRSELSTDSGVGITRSSLRTRYCATQVR